MDPLQNPAIVLLASVFPLIIAVVKQSAWSPQVNALIALIGYIVAGIIGTQLAGVPLTLENATAAIASVTVIGTVAYKLIWSNLGTGPTGTAPSIEQKIETSTSLAK